MIMKMTSLLFSSWRRCIRFVLLSSLQLLLWISSHTCLVNKFDILQMLSKRFEHEKQKLEANLGVSEHSSSEANSAACCIFCPEILCRKSGFDSWQDTLPLDDSTSFFLDMELLQELSSILLVDPKGLQLVRSIKLHYSWYDFSTWLLNVIELYPIVEVRLQIAKFKKRNEKVVDNNVFYFVAFRWINSWTFEVERIVCYNYSVLNLVINIFLVLVQIKIQLL